MTLRRVDSSVSCQDARIRQSWQVQGQDEHKPSKNGVLSGRRMCVLKLILGVKEATDIICNALRADYVLGKKR